jgi:hypothetical protein
MIENQKSFNKFSIPFCFKEEYLQNRHTRQVYSIQDNFTHVLELFYRSNKMVISILGKNRLTFGVFCENRIFGIKAIIEKREGFPSDQQRLYFQDKLFKDYNKLKKFDSGNDLTFILFLNCVEI